MSYSDELTVGIFNLIKTYSDKATREQRRGYNPKCSSVGFANRVQVGFQPFAYENEQQDFSLSLFDDLRYI